LLDFGFFYLLFSHWGSVNLFLAKKNSGKRIESSRFNCGNLGKKNESSRFNCVNLGKKIA
jgi:hypothetical protein